MCYKVLIQTTDDAINFKIYLRSKSKAFVGKKKKDKKTKIQKSEYLKNKKGFLAEIKSIYHNYLRAIIS